MYCFKKKKRQEPRQPHLNISDLLGGIYSATDGSVDPTGLTTAYARGEEETCVWSFGEVFESQFDNWSVVGLLKASSIHRSCAWRCPGVGGLSCDENSC